MIRDVIKNMTVTIDGRGYAGVVETFSPPDLSLMTEDIRHGGMDAPVAMEMGMEKLETEITLGGYPKDALSTWGVAVGAYVPITGRAALQSFDGGTVGVTIQMQGLVTKLERGDWTPGEKATLTIGMACHYYKETHGETVLWEIDIPNMRRVVNGVDVLEAQRIALGL